MTAWLAALAAHGAAGRPAVLVTVAAAEGSTPREAGAKMVVAAATIDGTIGGGNLEHQAIARARALLAEGGTPARLEHVALGPALGQCCGGAVQLLLERVDPAAPQWLADALALADEHAGFLLTTDLATGAKRVEAGAASDAPPAAVGDGAVVEAIRPPDLDIVLFGAGHVGRALAAVLGGLPCRVTWVDERPDQFPVEIASNVVVCATAAPTAQVRRARRSSYFLVMTHSHALDFDLCEAILRRDDAAFLGLIGSTTKRRRFEKRLLAHGITADRLRLLTCPIGIGGTEGKHPGVIAVATAAQILQLHAARAAAPAAA